MVQSLKLLLETKVIKWLAIFKKGISYSIGMEKGKMGLMCLNQKKKLKI